MRISPAGGTTAVNTLRQQAGVEASYVFSEVTPCAVRQYLFFFSSRRRHTRFDCDWSSDVCSSDLGISPLITAGAPAGTRRWFERIEDHRYQLIPHIHAVAQFTRHRGKKILEIGVGAGTDHLQWARAGARCVGVDLTDAAIELTRAHLAMHGFESDLRRADAEALPFPDESFDLVYSWGVIHHSEQPAEIVSEIHRVLRPGGTFIGMLYGRRSVVAF